MSIIRWDPFRDMNELFNRPFAVTFPRWAGFSEDGAENQFEWAPAIDVSETDTEYLVRADLPAVKREDVKVRVEGDTLMIEGERKYDKEQKNERYQRRESFCGSFSRTMPLPDNSDINSIRAESKDGVLTVHIKKTKTEKPKMIEVQVQ